MRRTRVDMKRTKETMNDSSVIAMGGRTASLFVIEARRRGMCAAWGFQRTVDDFEAISRRIWRPKAKSVLDMIGGYDKEAMAISPYPKESGADRIKADMWAALMRPKTHIAVFLDEIPKPVDPAGLNKNFFPANDDEMRAYRRRVKRAIGILGNRGRVALIRPKTDHPQMRNELLCLDSTKRYWRPILETCLPLYDCDGRVNQAGMSGFAKMAFMLITS